MSLLWYDAGSKTLPGLVLESSIGAWKTDPILSPLAPIPSLET